MFDTSSIVTVITALRGRVYVAPACSCAELRKFFAENQGPAQIAPCPLHGGYGTGDRDMQNHMVYKAKDTGGAL